jgi:hypothetical protein
MVCCMLANGGGCPVLSPADVVYGSVLRGRAEEKRSPARRESSRWVRAAVVPRTAVIQVSACRRAERRLDGGQREYGRCCSPAAIAANQSIGRDVPDVVQPLTAEKLTPTRSGRASALPQRPATQAAKSSRLFPAASASFSQRGLGPIPVQLFPLSSRYFTPRDRNAAFAPFPAVRRPPRGAARPTARRTANSSIERPAAKASRSHCGRGPRPLQVLPASSRYLTALADAKEPLPARRS